MLKDYLRDTPLFMPLKTVKGYFDLGKEFLRPKTSTHGAPWLYKIYLIKKFAKELKVDAFIETGTNIGETLAGVRPAFKELYSVELGDVLFEKAKKRFERYPEVTIYHADSATFMRDFVPKFQKKVIFWLDAHYSHGDTARADKDTPIEEELRVILGNWRTGSAILIDDGHEFNGHGDYPKFEDIREFVKSKKPELACVLEHNIIRIW